MFSCPQCDRSYKSRSSLARHLRNHLVDQSQHACTTCDVSFSRRDLLNRHLRIHDLPQRDNRASSPRERAAPRRRCHTACQPCRIARVRCNGEQPCWTCTHTQRHCHYSSSSSHRVSRISAIGTAGDTAQASPDISSPSIEPLSQSCHEAEPSHGPLPLTPSDLPTIPAIRLGLEPTHSLRATGLSDSATMLPTPSDPLGTLLEYDTSADIGLSSVTGCQVDDISWPWLHENLYLQGPPWDRGATMPPDFCPLPPPQMESPVPETMIASPCNLANLCASVPPQIASTPVAPAEKKRVLAELVAYVSRSETESRDAHRCYWSSMSLQVARAFGIGDWWVAHDEPVLFRMRDLYREHFAVLWPLLSPQDHEADDLHPLLFLVLASIGAMYGTHAETAFGAALHEEVRNILLNSLLDLEGPEESLLPLGQARLLVQVAALYFGQRRAFSFAQHLIATLITQARRMDLFSIHRVEGPTPDTSPETQIRDWQQMEARKRLAFGTLRADVFTSVLMNSRPLMSAEEIELELPAPDSLWNPPARLSTTELLDQIKAHARTALRVPFCDLAHIAFDRSEALLTMDPTHYETLLFGLQEPVWRFSHDPNLFLRLTGTNDLPEVTHRTGSLRRTSGVRLDPLGQPHRRMQDLHDHRMQLVDALRKWEQNYTAVRMARPDQTSRTSVLSSLLLFQISFLRISAPIEELHSVAYAISNHKSVDNRRLRALTAWARTPNARAAAEIACEIWTLLAHETQRPLKDRARHNLLAFSGLHHATVMLWVFAGSQAEDTPDASLPALGEEEDALPLCPRESTRLLRRIIYLYQILAPVGWCSFVAAAERLSQFTFPARASHPGSLVTIAQRPYHSLKQHEAGSGHAHTHLRLLVLHLAWLCLPSVPREYIVTRGIDQAIYVQHRPYGGTSWTGQWIGGGLTQISPVLAILGELMICVHYSYDEHYYATLDISTGLPKEWTDGTQISNVGPAPYPPGLIWNRQLGELNILYPANASRMIWMGAISVRLCYFEFKEPYRSPGDLLYANQNPCGPPVLYADNNSTLWAVYPG